jgi:hypothetical protein
MGAEMAPRTTRTLNPLPFQDLEPHRFEDLVRQLAYEFREWVSLEAIGRSGADEGIDIRGVERVAAAPSPAVDDADGDDEPSPVAAEQVWIFQCKREKSMSPGDVKKAVAASLDGKEVPYGFVLAAACDLSKKSRDAFRAEMVRRGIDEFQVWARGELEDMLFQAANDRLLFAYFGISLQPKKRSLATTLRSEIALKKQLKRLLEVEEGIRGRGVLLRDPTDDRYPHRPKDPKARRPRWFARKALHLRVPGCLAIQDGVHPAWIAPDGRGWDYLRQVNRAGAMADLPHDAWGRRDEDDAIESSEEDRAFAFWNEYVTEKDQAWLHIQRLVPLSRIIAIDPVGDGYFPIPHILVEFEGKWGPFREGARGWFEAGYPRRAAEIAPHDVDQIDLFPKEFPQNLFPPLPQFDPAASVKAASLGEAAEERSEKLITTLAERRTSMVEKRKQDRPVSEERHEKLEAFVAWREQVALPVLKRFEEDLRTGGHEARIAVHSTSGDRTPHESVELRVRLDAGGSDGNPDYRMEGHLRFEAVVYGNSDVGITVYPSQESSGRHEVAKPPALNALTSEVIENYVLGMLERLAAGRH